MHYGNTSESIKDIIIFELSHSDIYCLTLAIYYRFKHLLSQPMTPEIFEELAMLTMTNLKLMPIAIEKVLQEPQEAITIQSLLLETC